MIIPEPQSRLGHYKGVTIEVNIKKQKTNHLRSTKSASMTFFTRSAPFQINHVFLHMLMTQSTNQLHVTLTCMCSLLYPSVSIPFYDVMSRKGWCLSRSQVQFFDYLRSSKSVKVCILASIRLFFSFLLLNILGLIKHIESNNSQLCSEDFFFVVEGM